MNYINYLYSKETSVPTGYKFNTSVFNVELLEGVSGEEGDLKFIYKDAPYANAKYKNWSRLSVDKPQETSYYMNDGRSSVTGLITE